MNEAEFNKELDEIEEVAQKEPPNNNIFLYKHESRSMMTALRTKIVDLCKTNPEDNELLLKAARVNLLIGSNLFEVESFQEGYEYIERAELMVQVVRNGQQYDWDRAFIKGICEQTRTKFDDGANRNTTGLLMDIFNMAGYHWCSRGVTEKAVRVLKHCEAIYKDFDKWATEQGDKGLAALHIDDDGEHTDESSSPITKLRAKIEGSYTSTLFYLAQVHGSDANSTEASKYCHLTLQRQLASKKEFDRQEWAVNALGLCSFYLSANDYGASRHCIEAAERVFDKLSDAEKQTEQAGQTLANIHQAYAKWAYYLVKYYRDEQIGLQDDEEPKIPEALPIEWWTNFTCEGISEPSQPEPIARGSQGWPGVLKYFKDSVRHWKESLKWYVFDGFVTDYIQIMQDMSQFYKIILQWDVHDDKYGKMVDRHATILLERVKLLSDIPSQLNDKHYLNYMRQVWFELGEIYNDTAELRITQRRHKKEIADGSQPLNKDAINKIMKKSVKCFEDFSGSFILEDGKPPSDMDPDVCHAFISSRMHAIRIRSKFFAKSAKEEYKQLELAVAEYNELVTWAEAHPHYQEKLCKEETTKLQIDLAKEMIRLLPSKMRDIQKAFM
eukprot:TRINITY_DN5994_c4_g1_i1.p1 TRINITY_DN5994_c4_g1~~TRINITY_DN5994_c4_g1_i1.p1  ORF type:complete len:632 (+),score=146.32 TRINITY_DN5994_c4_g1_i1:61-1896(+)